ncbi:hypothetical protein M885DRAFT_622778, partial [Pelagophyceae sp. CCMP2097]
DGARESEAHGDRAEGCEGCEAAAGRGAHRPGVPPAVGRRTRARPPLRRRRGNATEARRQCAPLRRRPPRRRPRRRTRRQGRRPRRRRRRRTRRRRRATRERRCAARPPRAGPRAGAPRLGRRAAAAHRDASGGARAARAADVAAADQGRPRELAPPGRDARRQRTRRRPQRFRRPESPPEAAAAAALAAASVLAALARAGPGPAAAALERVSSRARRFQGLEKLRELRVPILDTRSFSGPETRLRKPEVPIARSRSPEK